MKKGVDELLEKCEDLGIINIETAGELSKDLLNDAILSTEHLLQSFDFSQITDEVNSRFSCQEILDN